MTTGQRPDGLSRATPIAAARRRRGRPRRPGVENDVLDAARRLAQDKGPDGWSMDELAAVARVGKATIYRRWKTKEAVLWDASLSAEFPTTGAAHDDLRAELTELMVRLCRWHVDDGRPLILARLLDASQSDSDARTRLDEYLRRSERPILAVLHRALSSGRLPAQTDCELVLDGLIGACVYRGLLRRRPIDRQFLEDLLDVALGTPPRAGERRVP